MKILIDLNLSPRWVDLLVAAGVGAAHWTTLGAINATDTEIMAYAKANDFIVMTHDLDFGAILAATHRDKPSVIQIRATETSPDTIGALVVAALQQMEAELIAGALLTIDTQRTRLRLLPLDPNP